MIDWSIVGLCAAAGFIIVFLTFRMTPTAEHGNEAPDGATFAPGQSWHEVLEVRSDANEAEVRSAYLRLTRQYHPDLVASLGPELRRVADVRMKEINEAYAYFQRLRSSA